MIINVEGSLYQIKRVVSKDGLGTSHSINKVYGSERYGKVLWFSEIEPNENLGPVFLIKTDRGLTVHIDTRGFNDAPPEILLEEDNHDIPSYISWFGMYRIYYDDYSKKIDKVSSTPIVETKTGHEYHSQTYGVSNCRYVRTMDDQMAVMTGGPMDNNGFCLHKKEGVMVIQNPNHFTNPITDARVVHGDGNTYAILYENGELALKGKLFHGQYNIPNVAKFLLVRHTGLLVLYYLTRDGELYSRSKDCEKVLLSTDIINFHARGNHVCMVKQDGSIQIYPIVSPKLLGEVMTIDNFRGSRISFDPGNTYDLKISIGQGETPC
jgi:hypothetical protein